MPFTFGRGPVSTLASSAVGPFAGEWTHRRSLPSPESAARLWPFPLWISSPRTATAVLRSAARAWNAKPRFIPTRPPGEDVNLAFQEPRNPVEQHRPEIAGGPILPTAPPHEIRR